MSEPISSGGIVIGIKYIFVSYVIPTLAILAGAIANALLEIKRSGWVSWSIFLADLFVAIVAGNIIYQFALIAFPAKYAIFGASLGGYMGPNGVRFLIKAIKLYKP